MFQHHIFILVILYFLHHTLVFSQLSMSLSSFFIFSGECNGIPNTADLWLIEMYSQCKVSMWTWLIGRMWIIWPCIFWVCHYVLVSEGQIIFFPCVSARYFLYFFTVFNPLVCWYACSVIMVWLYFFLDRQLPKHLVINYCLRIMIIVREIFKISPKFKGWSEQENPGTSLLGFLIEVKLHLGSWWL